MKKSNITMDYLISHGHSQEKILVLIIVPFCCWLGMGFAITEDGADGLGICLIGNIILTIICYSFYTSMVDEEWEKLESRRKHHDEQQKIASENEKRRQELEIEEIKIADKNWDDKFQKAKIILENDGLENVEKAITIVKHLPLSGRYSGRIDMIKGFEKKAKPKLAKELEALLRYKEAIVLWEELGNHSEAKKIRQKIIDDKKVDQTVVQGDQITKTEIKDSVVSKSNIATVGDDKFTKLKELKEMLSEGLIDDDEFKQMKKEILGK